MYVCAYSSFGSNMTAPMLQKHVNNPFKHHTQTKDNMIPKQTLFIMIISPLTIDPLNPSHEIPAWTPPSSHVCLLSHRRSSECAAAAAPPAALEENCKVNSNPTVYYNFNTNTWISILHLNFRTISHVCFTIARTLKRHSRFSCSCGARPHESLSEQAPLSWHKTNKASTWKKNTQRIQNTSKSVHLNVTLYIYTPFLIDETRIKIYIRRRVALNCFYRRIHLYIKRHVITTHQTHDVTMPDNICTES